MVSRARVEDRRVLLASAVTVSLVALTVAVASFAISVWQATVRWWEFQDKRQARIAVDPGDIHAEADTQLATPLVRWS